MPLPVAFDLSAVNSHSGGVYRYVDNLLKNMPATITPTCFTRKDDHSDWPNPARIAPSLLPRRVVWEHFGLGRAVKRATHSATVLHSVHCSMPLASRGIPSVVTVHDAAWFRDKHDQIDGPWYPLFKRHYFPHAIRQALSRADTVICMAERVADTLRHRLHVRAEIEVIPHGVDSTIFFPADASNRHEQSELESHGIRFPYVLFVGAIEPRKNVRSLIRAFARLGFRYADYQLVLAGEPWKGFSIDDTIAESVGGYGDKVLRTRFFPEDALPSLLRHASAFVYPSFEEGFGLPVLEALASGVPTITSADSVMSDFAGDAVVTVDPLKVDSITQAIEGVLDGDSPKVQRGFSVASAHTWALSASGHAAVYQALGS
jgi:glycosyltransferase involved in cell wall biosynthesis